MCLFIFLCFVYNTLYVYSAQATAVLSKSDDEHVDAAFAFGKHMGLAFQLVDDILDFTSTATVMGKPSAVDLSLGLATAPVLFAR